ncbi:type II secretion system F family protein [Hyphomicrobiales bacterium 4NK60-0047b]|jgi:tight adherence protein C
MYDLIQQAMNPQFILIVLTAVATFATVLTLTMPLFANDKLNSRMKYVSDEREKLKIQRLQEMAAESVSKGNIRHENKTGIERIVKMFNLRKALETEDLALKMKMAGLRGPAPLMTFLAARCLLPVAGLVLTGFYLNFVNDFGLQGMLKYCAIMAGGYVGFYLPNIFITNLIQKRQASIRQAFPDALDLLLICVQAGMSIEAAFRKVAIEIGNQSAELAEELTLTTAEMSYLQNRRQAFENLGLRTGLPGVRAVVTSLIQAEKYGTPLGTSLRAMAEEFRDERMNEAEKKAAALPPKLTVPMIVFFLPVLFAVILGPAVIKVTETSF